MTSASPNSAPTRSEVLLEAVYALLKKIDASPSCDALIETVFYDGADCDGYCLMEDIESELGL